MLAFGDYHNELFQALVSQEATIKAIEKGTYSSRQKIATLFSSLLPLLSHISFLISKTIDLSKSMKMENAGPQIRNALLQWDAWKDNINQVKLHFFKTCSGLSSFFTFILKGLSYLAAESKEDVLEPPPRDEVKDWFLYEGTDFPLVLSKCNDVFLELAKTVQIVCKFDVEVVEKVFPSIRLLGTEWRSTFPFNEQLYVITSAENYLHFSVLDKQNIWSFASISMLECKILDLSQHISKLVILIECNDGRKLVSIEIESVILTDKNVALTPILLDYVEIHEFEIAELVDRMQMNQGKGLVSFLSDSALYVYDIVQF